MADLSELTDDQLDAMLRDPSKIPVEAPAEPEATPVPEPAPPETPAELEAPAEPESPAEPTPEPEDYEKERLKLLVEEMEARQRTLDSKLGRFAGEADFWRKKAEAASSEHRREADTPDYTEPEITERRVPDAPGRDGLVAWAVTQAVQQTISKFEVDNPESAELTKEIAEYAIGNGLDVKRLQNGSDPMAAQQEVYRLLDEAFWHAKASRSSRLRAEMENRRTEQFSRQREAKQRAATSGGGATSAPTPPPKSLRDLSDAELDSEMKRLSSG